VRRILAALAVLVALAVLAGFAPPASAAPVTYVAPVSGPVVDPFRPPSTQYGAGNRGLEYATAPGSVARASAPGRVTFAGQVGGALHVVVQHADGVRTSYSFLRSINVRVGQVLQQNDPVGTTNDTFHFGARIGDAYVDPAILIASGPAQVHLVPDGEFEEKGAHDDRFALGRSVIDHLGSIGGRAYDWVRANGGSGIGMIVPNPAAIAGAFDRLGRRRYAVARGATGASRTALRRLGRELTLFARKVRDGTIDLARVASGAIDDATRFTALKLMGLLDQIVNMGEWAGPFAALAAALADIIQAWAEPCTPDDVKPPPMLMGQNRIAVFVAGLGSHARYQHAPETLSSEVDATGLGYAPENVIDFSYVGGRHPEAYTSRDTTGDLRDDARNLRDLLDEIAKEHPGAQVDIIAHSQGGLITREALAHDYDGPDHELPSIAHVVTLATPHHGADIATEAAWLRWSAEGRAIQQLARAKFKPFDLVGPGVAQLSETSDFIDRLNHRPLPDGIAFTSIASATDITVPAVRARLAGATNVIVDADPGFPPAHSHSSIKQSPGARRELRLAIGDAPPTCQMVVATAARAFSGAVIATAEDPASVVTP
jgi:peptidase M23-like protein/PGAP1-like protein